MLRRTAIAILLSVAVAACSSDGEPPAPKTVTITPDLTGYTAIPLGAAESGDGSATGSFSYFMVDGALDWYAFASHLAPSRAYRIILTAADGKEYAVASRRTDGEGTLGVHGVETMLMNRQCVGAEDPSRRSLQSARSLMISVKSDGSARGASGNDVVGSHSALPCGGNGDGDFAYVLQSADSVVVAP